MTEEEFKKAMGKTVVFIAIMIIILVGLGVVIFNKSGKETSIFESESAKETFENRVNEVNANNSPKEELTSEENTEPTEEQETLEMQEETTEPETQPEENV